MIDDDDHLLIEKFLVIFHAILKIFARFSNTFLVIMNIKLENVVSSFKFTDQYAAIWAVLL